MVAYIEGHLKGDGKKFGIVVARFNSFIAEKLLEGALDSLGLATGLVQERDVAEYALAYREQAADHEGEPVLPRRELEPAFASALDRRGRGVAGLLRGQLAAGRIDIITTSLTHYRGHACPVQYLAES